MNSNKKKSDRSPPATGADREKRSAKRSAAGAAAGSEGIEIDNETAEEERSESQTAQDRDHTIRGGDHRTTAMKEFPT